MAARARPCEAAETFGTRDGAAIMTARKLQVPTKGALLALALGITGSAQAEPLVPKSLYFTTIGVPAACTENPSTDPGIWRCSLATGTHTELNVQLDELLVPMEQISSEVWTDELVVAVLTGPFFRNWLQGATASTPGSMTRSQVVAEADLPVGVAACNDYRLDRHKADLQLHIVEIGRFCVLTRDPVQWPYILVGSVSLVDYKNRGGPFAESDIARAQSILATFRLAHP